MDQHKSWNKLEVFYYYNRIIKFTAISKFSIHMISINIF